jgi:glutamyl-tRNA synthetase
LHLGNLRTAILAWLFARAGGHRFILRIEDLDERSAPQWAVRQEADLAAIGLDWDGPVVYQSQRYSDYNRYVAALTLAGKAYECFCSRREIAEVVRAPHAPPGASPGTCRELTSAERQAARLRLGRNGSLRLKTSVQRLTVVDELAGPFTGLVDDFVIQRADGTPAYNLAVVVDDAGLGITQVVRGDDLLASTPRQAYLIDLLRFERPQWVHVPLVLNRRGERLSKRDGAVTLSDLAAAGIGADQARAIIARSLRLAGPGERPTMTQLLERFEPDRLQRSPWLAAPDAWLAV